MAFSLRVAIAGGGGVLDYVPPGTRAVVGLHLRSVIDSSLVQGIAGDLLKSVGAKWNATSPFPGVDPLKDLDEVIVASTMQGDHPPSLVICRGHFPLEQLAEGAVRYQGIPIKSVQDGDGIALLDDSTVLGGPMKELRAAIDRRARRSVGLSPALAGRAAQLSAKYAIWGAGTLPADFHPPAGGPEVLKSLDRFDFGVGLDNGLQLAAMLHSRSPDEMQKLAAGVQLFEMMAKSRPDASGTTIESHLENGTLTLSLAIPEETLKQAIAQQRGAIAQALAQSTGGSLAGSEPVTKDPPADSATAAQPASKETTITSDQEGVSVHVMLPGKR